MLKSAIFTLLDALDWSFGWKSFLHVNKKNHRHTTNNIISRDYWMTKHRIVKENLNNLMNLSTLNNKYIHMLHANPNHFQKTMAKQKHKKQLFFLPFWMLLVLIASCCNLFTVFFLVVANAFGYFHRCYFKYFFSFSLVISIAWFTFERRL